MRPDPDGEVTIAWTIAQQVMDLYRQDDPEQARVAAVELISALRDCPIGELARLGRTLNAWRGELTAYFEHPEVSNGPTENLNLKIKNTKRIRTWIPQLRPLPAAPVAQPRPHP